MLGSLIPEYPAGSGAFCTTRWSLVVATKDAASPEAQRALSDLCRSYWYPLYLFVRKTRRNAEDAEDLVQSFFEQLLERGVMAHAAADRGRFRAFLLARLHDFLVSDWRKAQRLKRGGGAASLSLDDPAVEERVRLELAEEQTPATLFDRAWAATLFDRAITRLAAECDADGKAGRFAVLKCFLTGARSESPIEQAARDLGLSLPAVKSVIHRLRGRYRELVRAEIAETLAEGEDVDDELRWLLSTLGAR